MDKNFSWCILVPEWTKTVLKVETHFLKFRHPTKVAKLMQLVGTGQGAGQIGTVNREDS